MKKRHKYIIFFISFILFILAWISLISFFEPKQIVEWIGIENVCIATFLISSIGGFSSLTTAPFYALIITFANGGASIPLLSLITGIGITIGDTLYFYFGYSAKKIASGKVEHYMEKLESWIRDKPSYIISLFVFMYASFAPLPNDLLTVPVGITGFKYKYIIFPLLFGNILHIFLVISIGNFGLSLFF